METTSERPRTCGSPRRAPKRSRTSAKRLAPAGERTRAEQRFAVVPLSRRDSFLVPLDSRAAARRSLTEYAALRSLPKRVVRSVLGAAWTFGLPEVFLRGRAQLPAGDEHAPRPSPRCARRAGPHLRDRTAARRVLLHTRAPAVPARRHAGGVRQDRLGHRHRRASARRIGGPRARWPRCRPSGCTRPGCCYAGSWQHLELCVTAPLPTRAKRVPSAHLPPVLALFEVAVLDGPITNSTGARLDVVAGSVRDAATGLEGQARGLGDALDDLESDCGAVELQFGRWHGDWVAWNMAEAPDGLYVWDWEYSRPDRPFGFDLLHFFFQDAFVARSQPADVRLRRSGRTRRAGVAPTRAGVRGAGRVAVVCTASRSASGPRPRCERGADAEPGLREPDISTLLAQP